jgi:hypothetical protein
MESHILQGSEPRIFTTDPDDPSEGRTLVWAKTRWYERVEDDETGAVEFPRVADTDAGLREWLAAQAGINPEDLTELDTDDDYFREVYSEFVNQTPLYPEAPELSDEEAPAGEPGLDGELIRLAGQEDLEERERHLDGG